MIVVVVVAVVVVVVVLVVVVVIVVVVAVVAILLLLLFITDLVCSIHSQRLHFVYKYQYYWIIAAFKKMNLCQGEFAKNIHYE